MKTPLAVLQETWPWARCETCRAYIGSESDYGVCEMTQVEQLRFGICLSFLPHLEGLDDCAEQVDTD